MQKVFEMENLLSLYQGKNIIVTGGASFIGSRLVEELVNLGARVTVIDNFSTGRNENLQKILSKIEVINGDLIDGQFTENSILNIRPEVVFHLAAIHGGRGFIEAYGDRILSNVVMDQNVFRSSVKAKSRMMVHASSACAYPIGLQATTSELNYLRESQAGFTEPGLAFPDGTYGWVKLFGEFQLAKIVEQSETRGRSARIFTAYGERENESHAAVALVAKALLGYDPYPVWGNGNQTRNFTYVEDTVRGLLLLGADLRDNKFDVINIGSSSHTSVNDFIKAIFEVLNKPLPKMDYQLDKPTGVASRASDNTKIQELFGWQPQTSIKVGVEKLVEWYSHWEHRAQSKSELESRMI